MTRESVGAVPGCRYPAGVSPEDQKALDDFAASKIIRTEMRDYLRADDGSVQPGSILGIDDQLWPHHPTSQVARLAMIAASEHLDVIEVIMEMAPTRTFITAPYSVVRGALVGAAQALWILGASNAVDRQQRCHRSSCPGNDESPRIESEDRWTRSNSWLSPHSVRKESAIRS